MKILFVGETWMGSSARSLREALALQSDVFINEIGEDHYLPKHQYRPLRAINRLLRPWQKADLEREISAKLAIFRPDVLMVYKGSGVGAKAVNAAKAADVYTVNVFPDYSPHVYGDALRQAIGNYDLVVSTKPFHPGIWNPIYGYHNSCVFVPHGYDPAVHLWAAPASTHDLDVVLVAGWRPEYHKLVREFASETAGDGLRVGLAGPGWMDRRNDFPDTWVFAGPLHGKSYGEWMRRGKIAIAPVNREVVVAGKPQPGDEETTRTYELAAAHCFFLHRRTDYVKQIYDEATEVPLWDNAQELAQLVRHYLPREEERRRMAASAHARAVPAYSIPNRAEQVLAHIRSGLKVHHERRP
jgi:spore maturation protein CgeB